MFSHVTVSVVTPPSQVRVSPPHHLRLIINNVNKVKFVIIDVGNFFVRRVFFAFFFFCLIDFETSRERERERRVRDRLFIAGVS